MEIAWNDLGRMLMSVEGWLFRLDRAASSDELWVAVPMPLHCFCRCLQACGLISL